MASSTPPPPPQTIKNRWIGVLIWQVITSTSIFSLLSLIITNSPFSLPLSFLSLLLFSLSILLLSLSFSLIASSHPSPSASLPLLLKTLVKTLIGSPIETLDDRNRVKRSLVCVGFLMGCLVSGVFGVVAMEMGEDLGRMRLVGIGVRGLVFGAVYGLDFVYWRRWVLVFPIVQRPLFYSFKRGLSSSFKHALRLSTLAFFCSSLLVLFLPDQFTSKSTMGQFIAQFVYSYIGVSAVSICWELSHHLLQVVHTRRCSFALPQGSAAAETNPSEVLLEVLEQSNPRSLLQYLAYLDLCMVSESNVEPWRRAAFFEETGETYRRIISVCLRPLEQLTSRLGEGLEGLSGDKSDLLAQQLNLPTDTHVDSKLLEALNDIQLCTWCARTVASLTARSHREDRYGVAQLTSCNIAVVSTLLSTFIAVEACLGKKTNPQPAQLMGPASIRWANVNTVRRDVLTAIPSKKRVGVLYDKAYMMADVLRTSIYQIVSAFHADMQANVKASVLEKNWIMDGKPLYGTREILVQKLVLFLDFRAN